MSLRLPGLLRESLRRVLDDMDAAYAQAATACGFICSGCENSCCRTRFHHHTLLEFLYLREGFNRLPVAWQEGILSDARAVVAQHEQAVVAGAAPGAMCPLNAEGRCRLYDYRPMICRLHGIPHELHAPGRPVQAGPGCEEFQRRGGRREDCIRLDRTPLYTALAQLETECRQALGMRRKIRMTIAEILLNDGLLE
jgi:Fe-S-cluster containining protein